MGPEGGKVVRPDREIEVSLQPRAADFDFVSPDLYFLEYDTLQVLAGCGKTSVQLRNALGASDNAISLAVECDPLAVVRLQIAHRKALTILPISLRRGYFHNCDLLNLN